MGRHFVDMFETAVIYLLVTTSVVEVDNFYSFCIVKVGNMRIIESNMTIFANAHEDNIYREFGQYFFIYLTSMYRVGVLPVEIVYRFERNFVENSFFQKLPNPCGASLSSPMYSSM